DRRRVRHEVREAAVEQRREQDARQPPPLARVDAEQVEVRLGEEVEHLEQPERDEEATDDEQAALDALSLRIRTAAARHGLSLGTVGRRTSSLVVERAFTPRARDAGSAPSRARAGCSATP